MAEKQISDPLERKYLVQNLLTEPDSDEDGGPKARFEIDSDFSDDEADNISENAVSKRAENQFDYDFDKPKQPNREWANMLTKVRKKHNTGPKGVKADYEEAKKIMERINETKILQNIEALKLSDGAFSNDPSISYNATKSQKRDASDNEDDDDKYCDDINLMNSNDPELQKLLLGLKQQRMADFYAISNLPHFGRALEVSKYEFIDHLKDTDSRSFVVVHLYEPYILTCVLLNNLIDQVAASRPYIKFLKLRATEAKPTLSHTALPSFMVYQANHLVGDVIIKFKETIMQPLGFGSDQNMAKFGVEEFEWFLSSFGIPLPGDESKEAKAVVAKLDAELNTNENNTSASTTFMKLSSSSSPSQFQASGYVNTASIGKVTRQTRNDSAEGISDDDWN